MKGKYLLALRKNKAFSHVRVYFAERDNSSFGLQFRSESGRLIDWKAELLSYAERKARSPKPAWFEEARKRLNAVAKNEAN